MNVQPRRTSAWAFGSDPSKVDFFLAPPEVDTGIQGVHGEFFQDQHAATLMIRANSARPGVEIFLNNAEHVQLAGRMMTAGGSVMIGVQLYRLEFTDLRRDVFVKQINQHRFTQLEFPRLLSPTPSSAMYVVQGKFLVQPATYRGTQGSVGFGHRLCGGPPIVAKRMVVSRNTPAFEDLSREIAFLTALRNQVPDSSCIRFVSICATTDWRRRAMWFIFAEDFDEARAIASNQGAGVVDVTLIIEPATNHSLQDVLKRRPQSSYTVFEKRRIGADWAAGLASIHSLPAIHCDVSPNNLGLSAFAGVVLDLGHMRQGECSDVHGAGTIPCLAPEIMALKRGNCIPGLERPVSAASDVWSLGLAMALWLLDERAPTWASKSVSADGGVTTQHLKLMTMDLANLTKTSPVAGEADLDAAAFKDLVQIVQIMLNPSPQFRILAQDASARLMRDEYSPCPPSPVRLLPHLLLRDEGSD